MTTPSIITLASKNAGKQKELSHWLADSGLPFSLALNESVGDIEETGDTFLSNALLKAQQTPPVINGGFVLGEDSGMVVDALDGLYGISPFPGLYSNRWLSRELRAELLGDTFPNEGPLERHSEHGVSNRDLCRGILKLMEGITQRTARYCCGMALWHPDHGLCFEVLENVELEIIQGKPRGLNGFGYDPIVIARESSNPTEIRTVAEISVNEKNRISHRGRAFQQVIRFLQQNQH